MYLGSMKKTPQTGTLPNPAYGSLKQDDLIERV